MKGQWHSWMRIGLAAGLSLGVSSVLQPRHGWAQEIDPSDVILQVEGVLDDSDAALQDGSRYDEHTFEGEAGQTVSITLESVPFDAYLMLLDPNGERIAENDDFAEHNSNAWLSIGLPQTGTYRIWVNAYDDWERGNYRLVAQRGEQAPIWSAAAQRDVEANQYLQQGIEQYQVSQFRESLASSQAALDIYRKIGDRVGEGRALGNLGIAYRNLGQYQQAIDLYEQKLVITREIGDRAGEGNALNNLGFLYKDQGQPELAIIFYKQSVNVREQIRQDIQALPAEDQEAYTKQYEITYRNLADLLLEQGRILEAQRVLELLKVEELRDYTNDERIGEALAGIGLLDKEAEILETFDTLVNFGQTLRDCEQNDCSSEKQLRDQRDSLARQYNQAITDLVAFIETRLNNDPAALSPDLFAGKAAEIIQAQPGTVIVYPVVLDDKLWILWAAEGRVLSRREIPVSRKELGETVVRFRELLEDRTSDLAELQATAQTLYSWLIAPIEAELSASDIQNLVFALDRTTRYIPMAALHDGEQYLIEKYTVTTILSADLTRVDERSPIGTQNVQVLGAGVSEANAGFEPLPNVPIELDNIIRDQTDPNDTVGIYPGAQLLDQQFTFSALRDSLTSARFLHIATHAEFVPGQRDASYLLMGNGERLPIPEVEVLNDYFDNVYMVVLSACQTGLGGPDEEGLEIAGLGYYFLKGQVDAVMATLWSISDRSTSDLMAQFYTNLASATAAEPVTKAEALQNAQLAMLRGGAVVEDGAGEAQRFAIHPVDGSASVTDEPNGSRSHPYYWAPFILIGNGL